jgi:hypothetical protein
VVRDELSEPGRRRVRLLVVETDAADHLGALRLAAVQRVELLVHIIPPAIRHGPNVRAARPVVDHLEPPRG